MNVEKKLLTRKQTEIYTGLIVQRKACGMTVIL